MSGQKKPVVEVFKTPEQTHAWGARLQAQHNIYSWGNDKDCAVWSLLTTIQRTNLHGFPEGRRENYDIQEIPTPSG